MASHTSGPWTVVDGRQIYGPNRDDELLAEATDTAEGLEGSDGVADANAVLMASSPDLLAACMSVMEYLSNGAAVHPGSLVQAEVFNAIAKARGNS